MKNCRFKMFCQNSLNLTKKYEKCLRILPHELLKELQSACCFKLYLKYSVHVVVEKQYPKFLLFSRIIRDVPGFDKNAWA